MARRRLGGDILDMEPRQLHVSIPPRQGGLPGLLLPRSNNPGQGDVALGDSGTRGLVDGQGDEGQHQLPLARPTIPGQRGMSRGGVGEEKG